MSRNELGRLDSPIADGALERALRARADVAVPHDLLLDIVGEARRTRQRRGWPGFRIGPSPLASPGVRLAWQLLLLVMALALAAGAVVVGSQLLPDRPPALPGRIWTPVEGAGAFEDPEGGLRMAAGAARGGTAVVIGSGPGGGEVWTSADGVAWTRSRSSLFAEAELRDVTASDLGFVIVGGKDGTCAAWRSGEGSTWQPIPFGASCPRGRLHSVAAHGTTVVAVGEAPPPDEDPEEVEGPDPPAEPPALLLVWEGGDEWQGASGVPASEAGTAPVLAAGGGGFRLVSGGSTFHSPTGHEWRRMGDGPGLEPRTATTLGTLTIAGGSTGEGAAIVWTDDGVTWRPAAIPPTAGGSVAALTPMAAGLVAVGDGPDGAAAWWSADGRTWTAADVEMGTGGRIRDVVVLTGRLLALGERGRGSAIWISQTEGGS